MNLRQYIRQREIRIKQAEKLFERRILRALEASIEPVLNEVNKGNLKPSVVSKANIKPLMDAYKWVYVTWGRTYGKWFLNNFNFGKKDKWEDEIETVFVKRGAKKVSLLYETTKELLRGAIQEALKLEKEGASIERIAREMRRQVSDVGGAMSRSRALTIARTEVISAANTASYESARSTGLELEKKWLTGGANIRDTHLDAEAQGWIGMNDAFQVGSYEMEYPGDPSGGPEEVINCKCTVIYRTI